MPIAAPDPPLEMIAADNVPNEDAWNMFQMKRAGNTVSMLLNGKLLVKIPVRVQERPGVNRYETLDLKLRSIRLTGDWPDEFLKDLVVKE